MKLWNYRWSATVRERDDRKARYASWMLLFKDADVHFDRQLNGLVRLWTLISYGSSYRRCYGQDRNYLA